jgi:drug/metabolite transporter (DMT)-like permease
MRTPHKQILSLFLVGRYNAFSGASSRQLTGTENRMKATPLSPSPSCPPTWTIALALGLVYLSWGTTYFAIRAGVHTYHLPPALFGGTRVCLAGILLLAFLRLRGETIRLPRGEILTSGLGGLLLFVGGNGFINVAMDSVASSVAAILVSSTPLWLALMETLWPGGEKLATRGWLGLVMGMGGVLLLLAPRLDDPADFLRDLGPLFVLCSTCAWALGSLVLRHRKRTGSHLTAAAYQMVLGGGALSIIGIGFGEGSHLTAERLTFGAIGTFVYLLVVGSLIGFVAFNWLLGHVPAALVGTYAYVNPLVAILIGWLLGGEDLTAEMIGGMVIILLGVALVRGAVLQPRPALETAALQDQSAYRETRLDII